MEKIISNPGLQHLAEKVFWNLNAEDVKNCAQINQSCKQILQNPIFGLRKFEGLSKKNRNDWIKGIQSVKNSDHGIAIISYLKWNFKKDIFVDLPFYTSPDVQHDFRKKLWEICKKNKMTDEDLEIVQILAHLADNPNAPGVNAFTPIYFAARNGHTEIVKILAPLTFIVLSNKDSIFRFFAGIALFVLSPFHPIRRIAIQVLEDPIFGLIVILTILANCYVMILPDSE